ncbi:hypothetical protein DQ04_01201090 [Trypanosoma grayi]|uniref:hypothetical protein n=1 Tax=Trypanosoma grayi TaxID=71804 RepID=UPI0004F40F65|nr:hypothetical protein DQ04_01201090 [Trypanosoma grayi]KEG13123.1 hypothetical protein DQ04_01201090 [Trypanosoma grayi]
MSIRATKGSRFQRQTMPQLELMEANSKGRDATASGWTTRSGALAEGTSHVLYASLRGRMTLSPSPLMLPTARNEVKRNGEL